MLPNNHAKANSSHRRIFRDDKQDTSALPGGAYNDTHFMEVEVACIDKTALEIK